MSDPINPSHYKRGGLEAIDVIRAFELDYLLGTVAKYLLRSGYKGSRLDHIDDLKKASWFLHRKIAEMEALEGEHPTVVPLPIPTYGHYPTPAPEIDLTTTPSWIAKTTNTSTGNGG